MSMSSEHWKKIEGIVRRASDLKDESARAAYLSEACAGDEELRHTVERLLAQGEGAETLPKDTVFDEIGMEGFATLLQERDPLIGGRLGAYQITTELGYGGMGAVYLAERVDGAFKQRVAIKLVKRGMDTNFILRRFRQERQILAALNHPFIARLLDGGTTSDGLPYFVMEYIQGETLYRYSDEKKLSVAERLQLFRQVCEAVAYAHSNNVIHRDLKPSNVLIRSDGTPKLLDFGIAKVLNPEFAADTIDPTATHMRLMTPEYASPEQVRGEAAAPTSDVYSLGVLLYELLTGHRPYRLRSRAPHEIARVICEEEPQRPSEGLTYEDNLVPTGTGERLTLEQIYRARGSNSLQALRQQLVGDLERIVLKALRKDPAERYQSALAFADDITRYLEGKPVAAQSHNPAKLSPAGNRPSVVKTLAVLPLRLLNSDAVTDTGDKYLSIGLADAMITRLSGIHSLAVRPTSAVLRYGNDATDPFQAGRELAVDYALDGRIRIAGERIRVSLQLLDVASGTSVWASQFDEQFADVLELEDSISAKVADALLPLLSEDERRRLNKRGTSNAAAFEAYLRGRFHWNTFTEEGFAKAIRYFNQAISLAPDYALAYTGIADYYNFLGVYAVLPFAEASAKAKEAALKAVALDAKLAEAYAALGFATLMHDFDWDLASQHLRRAIELNPNYATGRLWYGSHLGLMGRFDEGFVQARQARELDPLTPIVHHTMNWMLYYARRYDESIAGTRRLIANEPQYGLARLFLCLVLFRTGQHTELWLPGSVVLSCWAEVRTRWYGWLRLMRQRASVNRHTRCSTKWNE